MKTRNLDITPSPRLLEVLGQIPLDPWQCLAEFVDNSLDELLKMPDRTADNPLVIDITVEEVDSAIHLKVKDNGLGMDAPDLERSIRAGHSGKNRYGSLGLFGMGFNIATARLGNRTTVVTSQRGSAEALKVTIDFKDLQRSESFSVPLETLPAQADASGTEVTVVLKKEMAEAFTRPRAKQNLMAALGDVYSYLLREAVPGLTRPGMSAPVPAVLRFNGEVVSAKLPCIWRDDREVPWSGQQVKAIQYIERTLPDATACLECGYWDRSNGPEQCEECESTNLELRERRIWGWIGIQRYIDSNRYGIDFLRYGRKILRSDKSIFTYTDPDTLETDTEYPIEMPANQGRIVGEIHLDHVPVTYQKNDFVRHTRDWSVAMEVVRGAGPLKPRSKGDSNNSPLAVLFSAFRRNDPGLRYLVPGDGERAIHTKAREWASYFDKGVDSYLTDEVWFKAAEEHQRTKDHGGSTDDGGSAGGGQTGAGTIGDVLLGGGTNGTGRVEVSSPQAPVADALAAARQHGAERRDLSGVFNLGKGLGSWELTVISTPVTLTGADGLQVPSLTGVLKGTSIELFVSSEHALFREYGRDVRDVALLHAAGLIRDLAHSDATTAAIYSQLVQLVADLRVTPSSILERIERTLERLRLLILPLAEQDPAAYWAALDSSHMQAVEEAAAAKFPTSSHRELVEDGRFVLACNAESLAAIVRGHAADVFDGRVFKASLRHRRPAAQELITEGIARALVSLGSFQRQDDVTRQKYDVQLAQITLDYLDDQVTTEDVLPNA